MSANKLIPGVNDLATKRPDLAAEWNYEKNGDLRPEMLSFGSKQVVWWKCKLGHEWKLPIAGRKGCPYCAGQKAIVGVNDLATTNPELVEEWDYEKNGNLKPEMVMRGSHKKIWWIGKCGHSWLTTPHIRTKGKGCPICAGRKVIAGVNDLKTLNPEATAKWNYVKNGSLTPEMVTVSSNKKVWWICEKGHEWEATIDHITHDRGCPYCSNQKVLIGYNDLATTNPKLASEWNYNKNGNLTPQMITSGSNKKYWWECSLGHEWQATAASRSSGNGCPYCAKARSSSFPEQAIYFYVHKVCPDAVNKYRGDFLDKMELDVFIPSRKIGIEFDGIAWHTEKAETNETRKYSICTSEGIKLIRIKETHKDGKKPSMKTADIIYYVDPKNEKSLSDAIQDLINRLDPSSNMFTRTNPFHFFSDVVVDLPRDRQSIHSNYLSVIKNSLLDERPDIALKWDYERNKKVTPAMVTVHSGKKVWWKCGEGHSWIETVANIVNGSGCPYCAGQRVIPGKNDLKTIFPEIAEEWDYQLNGKLKPDMVMSHSNLKVWWKCSRGHSYKAQINNRSNNRGCPYCSNHKVLIGFNDLLTTHPFVANKWDYEKNGDKKPEMFVATSEKKVFWKCPLCGHSWKDSIIKVTGAEYQTRGCSKCADIKYPRTRVIKSIDRCGNETVFPSIKEAGNYLKDNGFTTSPVAKIHISDCCRGKRKSAYGFKWQYVDEEQ